MVGLGVDGRDADHVDDFTDTGVHLQDVEGLAQAEENRSNHLEAAHLLDELVRDVACGQIGKSGC